LKFNLKKNYHHHITINSLTIYLPFYYMHCLPMKNMVI